MPTELMVIGADGRGLTTLLTTNEIVFDLDWIDERHMLVSTLRPSIRNGEIAERGTLLRIDTVDGTAMPLWEFDAPIRIDLSPDRAWIAARAVPGYIGTPKETVLLRSDGTDLLRLGPLETAARWLPDGRYIFFRDGQLLATSTDSYTELISAEPRLAQIWQYEPLVDPTGRRLAFYSGSDDRDLMYMDLDGGTISKIASDYGIVMGAWSSDGERLLYATNIGHFAEDDPTIWYFDSKTGVSMALVRRVDRLGGIDWSPDGASFAYTIHSGEHAGLYTHALDARNPVRLSAVGALDNVHWIAPSRLVARQQSCWRGCEAGFTGMLLWIDGVEHLAGPSSGWTETPAKLPAAWSLTSVHYASENGAVTTLEQRPDTSYLHAAISPNGQRVAFTRSVSRREHAFELDLAENSFVELDPLPDLPPPPDALRPVQDAGKPIPSPDGKRAVQQRRNKVYIIEDGQERLLADLPDSPGSGTSSQPLWSPDGARLAWFLYRLGVVVIDAMSGDYRVVATRSWCHMNDVGPELGWSDPTTLVIIAHPTLC